MSVWVLISRLLLVEAVFLGVYFGLKYLTGVFFVASESTFGAWLEGNLYWLIFIHLTEVFLLVYVTLIWGSTMYSISTENISTKQGIFSIKQNTYNMKNIESVKVRQDFWGLLFRYGTVILYAPTLKETVLLKHISHPKTMARDIESFMRQTQSQYIPIDLS